MDQHIVCQDNEGLKKSIAIIKQMIKDKIPAKSKYYALHVLKHIMEA